MMGKDISARGDLMKKLAIVINGSGGVGKDTLCEFAARHYRVKNISSITPIKELAARCGWQGEKTDRARKFLSDLKRLTVEYNDFPTVWTKREYDAFCFSDEEILFVHIREPEEIGKFVRATGGEAKTLLIRGGNRTRKKTYGNASDDNVENYPYDYCFVNDAPLAGTEERFVAFLKEIFAETKFPEK